MLYARASVLPAIAALALTSTGAFAQEAQPVPTDPPPATSSQPAPATDAAPPAATTESSTTATDTVTETAAPARAATKVTRTKRVTRSTATPKPVATARTVTHTVATRTVAPVATAPAPAATPSPAAPAPQSAVNPVVDVSAKPAPAPTTAAATPARKDDTLPIAAGGALALLALGGGAYALSRRRRHVEDEEWVEDETVAHEPAEAAVEPAPRHDPVVHEEQPAIVAPAAFAWGNESRTQERDGDRAEDDDRLPGESWVQRAYRGPTANNPSVSLRARLKRAAFFDKRERDVAAGTAEPVDMDAGLPEAMVDEQERELA